ncbi:MAG: hypothetical protein H0X30_20155 [Anaerolineae bacterium]|nr:hypothetical protein [Anaerolineae bacterium]
MAKQKRATATIKIAYREEVDLIAWWNSVPRGTRNAVIKDLMRDYIDHNQSGYRLIYPRNMPQPFNRGRFTQICCDAAQIRTALMDLLGYVGRVIQQVVVTGGVPPNSRSPNGDVVIQGADADVI